MQRRPASCRRIRDTSHLLTKNKLAVLYTCVSQQRFLLILVSRFYLRRQRWKQRPSAPPSAGLLLFGPASEDAGIPDRNPHSFAEKRGLGASAGNCSRTWMQRHRRDSCCDTVAGCDSASRTLIGSARNFSRAGDSAGLGGAVPGVGFAKVRSGGVKLGRVGRATGAAILAM